MRKATWGLGAGGAALAGYALAVRPWTHRWGATDDELYRRHPGDALVPEPDYQATLAVTVKARPAAVWPWLMQLGRGRGGLYSYDWLDRLFGVLDRPSADRLLGLPPLRAGDAVPVGRDPARAFPVRRVDEGRALVLGGEDRGVAWSWALLLYPEGIRTRLVSRNRVRLPPGLRHRLPLLGLDPAAFLMTRRMLLGLRDRAEGRGRFRASGECWV